jgi:hypothetical protein
MPPVVVEIIVEPVPEFPLSPMAMQSNVAEHAIPLSRTAVGGGVSRVQVDPLVEVLTT